MANRYWVGGSGTWDNSNTANWSTTSGGASGASAPTSSDDAIFDTNSGTAAVVDVTGTATCQSCTVNKSDINLSLSGSPVFSSTLTFTTGTITIGANTLTCFAFSTANSNARTLSFGTGGNITVTGNNAAITSFTNTNLVFVGTPIINCTYSGSTGTRTISGNTGGISYNITAGTDTVATGTGNAYVSLNFSGFGGTLTNTVRFIAGDLTLSATMTLTAGSNRTEFSGTSGVQKITTNGQTLDFPITFNGVNGTFRFEDTFVMGATRAMTLMNGTLNANDKAVTIGTFALANGTKTLTLGSGTWTVAGASWNANTSVTGLTVSASTGTIDMTSGSAKTFSGGGKTWPTLNQGGAGALTIAQSNTFSNITNTVQPATITLNAGTTQTVNAFGVSGTAGNQITLQSSSAGSLATLSKATGAVTVSYVSIKDVRAQGNADWFARVDQGAVDLGNTPGWRFIARGMQKVFRRVFGQPVFQSIFSQ